MILGAIIGGLIGYLLGYLFPDIDFIQIISLLGGGAGGSFISQAFYKGTEGAVSKGNVGLTLFFWVILFIVLAVGIVWIAGQVA